ncbi:MAG: dihydrodipicolinate synthase family protein [Bacteroidales bacterium]|nr:dihydrodipicolinate synthase family protein [Bacteroidales bacterium]MDD3431003.1 dihydrodipicolinate synthase family protein [Bacteroidales bacterium]MDD4360981.1 dihydrodipicolinate synthase family protein [Bacteroidales bacterium]MDD4429999.1 dihydrodipicolinate synthase family protein [Bacteroidales bacterium]
MTKQFSGVVVPMVSPLLDDLRVDTTAVKRIMMLFAAYNISPLVLGTTGESPSITEKESLRCMRAACRAKSGEQKVYAGLVGNKVAELLNRGKMYADMGVDALVSTLPSYYTLSTEQMRAFYLTLADSLSVPVFMYNIKSTTQMSLPLDLVAELSQHPNIAGLKDSERDPARLNECIQKYRNRSDFSFFCGWGAQGANSLILGADGIVPSTGNVVPEMYYKLFKAVLAGNTDGALHYQQQTDRVAELYQKGRSLGSSLAALKVLMKARNLCGTIMMPPLTSLSAVEEKSIVEQFNKLAKNE